MKAIVAERGQVTIPKPLRQKLGIKPGTTLDLFIDESKLVAIKLTHDNPVDKVYGHLKQTLSTDAIIDQLRGKA